MNTLVVICVVTLVLFPLLAESLFEHGWKSFKNKDVKKDVADNGQSNKTRTVGTKAIPLRWVRYDKSLKRIFGKDVAIYGFFYDSSKKTVYGIRHWQGWEQIGYSRIPLSQLILNENFGYQKMGLLLDKQQVSYNVGMPTVVVVGWVFIPSKGVCGVYWDKDACKFSTIKAESLLDTDDPQLYYSI